MKKTILAIAAIPLMAINVANAQVTESRRITLSNHPSEPACGLTIEQESAVLGEEIPFTVTGPVNGLPPFINVTDWTMEKKTLNPNLVYLDGIAYKYGKFGMPVKLEEELGTAELKFTMKRRPKVRIGQKIKPTDLTLTVTCFDQNDPSDESLYNEAKDYWQSNDGLDGLIDYNKKLGWDFKGGTGQKKLEDPKNHPNTLKLFSEMPNLP